MDTHPAAAVPQSGEQQDQGRRGSQVKTPRRPSRPQDEPTKEIKKPSDNSKQALNSRSGEETKLTPAELKKRAKEEKAAKRAREKEARQGGAAAPGGAAPADAPTNKGHERRVSTSQGRQGPLASKQQQSQHHQRKGSITTQAQKQLPIRSSELAGSTSTAAPSSKKDSKKVALFSHLYSQPRRTSIANASKDVHPAVLALGLQMSSYVICGSNARCAATLLVFKRVIESYTTPVGNSLPRHLPVVLSSQIEYLTSCRPLSVSMGNAIRWLKVKISEIDPDTSEDTARADLCRDIDNFINERITVAGQVIADFTCSKIQDGDVIITYAKSSTVQHTLYEAYKRGKKFSVIVVDSRPMFEGKNLARALAKLGIQVQYTLTHAINHVINRATKVLLGAHAMMSNGRLFSRVGTALVAMMAQEASIPVIVCCESIKFTDRVALDSIVHNEVAPPDELLLSQDHDHDTVRGKEGDSSGGGEVQEGGLHNWRDVPGLQLLNLMYDLTPADCISVVITEYGFLPPSSVPVVHRLSVAQGA